MSDPASPDRPQPETDKYLVDRNQGPAERAVLGRSPYGTIMRIVLAVVAFVVLFGTIFFFLQN
jgi:hypothetical protein